MSDLLTMAKSPKSVSACIAEVVLGLDEKTALAVLDRLVKEMMAKRAVLAGTPKNRQTRTVHFSPDDEFEFTANSARIGNCVSAVSENNYPDANWVNAVLNTYGHLVPHSGD
jgi:hypothetical protein